MKKTISIVVALVLVLSLSATAFADDGEQRQVEGRQRNGIRIRILFKRFFPEGLEQLIELQEAHREFHEEAREDREEHIAEVREDFTEIREAYENEEISKREAWRQLMQLRRAVGAMREELQAAREEKAEAQKPVHDRLVEIREEIKVILGTEPIDEAAIAELLGESLGLFGKHLENDIYYHNMFIEIADGYGY